MKRLAKDILFSVVVGFVIPGIILNYMVTLRRQFRMEKEEIPQNVLLSVRVRNADGTVTEENMDSYLLGVVMAEMPASFEEEALKAQSVVARTYARKAWETGGKHRDGSVCRESSCCQAWVAEEDYIEQGGTAENVEKIWNAVQSTSGQVLTYDGQLIEATYFSCSGGSTEDAAAVWGTDFAYLQAVDSPGEEGAAYYEDTVLFTPEEVEKKLNVSLSGSPAGWVSAVTYTEGGGVDSISIGGTYFTGTEIRQKLGLRSTAFSVVSAKDTIAITTRGYGHRVGMSQYGADAMAVDGSSYEEILAHYYQGTELTMMN